MQITNQVFNSRGQFLDIEKVLMDISEGCYYLNDQMEFLFINKAAESIIEKPREELMWKCLWDVLPRYKAADLYEFFNKSYQEQSIQKFEMVTEYSNVTVEAICYPDPNGLLVLFTDITERKVRQEEQMYVEKLKIIGEMAAGVAHEIRNPMTSVKGFLQLAAEKQQFSEYKDILFLMVDEINHVNRIISEFLDISKKNTGEMGYINLNEVITLLYPLLQTRAVKEDKFIELDLGHIPDVKVDQNEIRQLLLNMVNNSLDAISPKKKVHITTRTKNDRVVLSITDEGEGIPDHIIDRISTPFVTSKSDGTGLGLAICFAIAKRNHATIDFTTNSMGTSFNIRFNQ